MGNFSVDIGKMEQAAGTSPESIYMLFILSIAKAWFEYSVNLNPAGCERSLMSFMALAVPDAARRAELVAIYMEHKNKRDSDEIAASIHVMGLIVGTITESLGLTNKDYVEVF
jgi:hypothetical protein